MSQLALPDALHEDYSKLPSSQGQLPSSCSSSQQQPPQHFQSLPTPPTPELTVAALQSQSGGHGGAVGAAELHAVPVNQATCAPASGPVATYGAALADPCKQLYQWQAGSNFCTVMGHPQFAPAAATAFPSRRPPPLYYQAAEKTSAVSAQTGPLRSPMSEFVVMKECMDGEWGG